MSPTAGLFENQSGDPKRGILVITMGMAHAANAAQGDLERQMRNLKTPCKSLNLHPEAPLCGANYPDAGLYIKVGVCAKAATLYLCALEH